MLGKLSWAAIPFDQPIPLVVSLVLVIVVLAVLAWITVKGHWPYLWREWITSVDHKRIGVMYCMLAMLMLVRGFSDAILMRSQQALSFNSSGYLPPEHFDQIFSAHGTIMIFFMAMPFLIGLMNFAVPLQIGARDVAFPTFNSVSLWLSAAAVLLVNISLLIGEFSQGGWTGYPPLTELKYSPGVGVDYWLWALQISGVGTLLTGVNFVTTILKLRAPGMTLMRMPMFTWTAFAASLLMVAAFPVLTATLAMLLLDRYLDFHFFTTDMGGNPMLYVNLFWAWGHPEVYILILPSFGIYSEVVSTFSGKPLFGYRSMVLATMAICLISFMVWLHHFFTMGASANVNGLFGIASMLIAIPTGVKIFNWLFTMWGGRVRLDVPILWAIAFMISFVVGGMTGVILANPPADFVLHNSLFLVAHFHNVIIPGVLFAAFAGYTYWFPKAFGFRLDERWGMAAFWLWVIGFYVAWMPGYVLGFEGMTRRLQHYDVAAWRPWLLLMTFGVVLILLGIFSQIVQLYVSIRDHLALRDRTGDPWDGRTLEWMTMSPPPQFNFAALPNVSGEEPYWDLKQRALAKAQLSPLPRYEPIELPRNAPTGFVTSFFAVVTGFALIWHIWWMATVGVVGAFATFVVFAWRDIQEYELPVEEVERVDTLRREARVDMVLGRDPTFRAVPVAEKEDFGAGIRDLSGGYAGPAPKRIVTGYGFWIFLLSDFVMFSAFYSAYAVLSPATAGGPGPRDLFNLNTVALETTFLLLSSFLCGMASIAVNVRSLLWAEVAFVATGLFGLGFLALELNEFARMIAEGNGPQRSAFLSAFFALVGCHGLHVTVGLLWLGTMMAQVFTKGFKPSIRRRVLCWALFWHALDIIWVGIFTNVYLLGFVL